MKDLVISGKLLEELHLTPAELMIEVAVYLYDQEKLTMGQAKKLARLTQIEFQKEMSQRGVCIKYDAEDFARDIDTLKRLG
ncbi:MAG: UPF0175 family protein [Bacteroidota bacterium]